MVKIHKNLLLKNQESSEAESWYIASGTQCLLSLFKRDDCKLTFDLLMARSNLRPYTLVPMGKCLKIIFSNSIQD